MGSNCPFNKDSDCTLSSSILISPAGHPSKLPPTACRSCHAANYMIVFPANMCGSPKNSLQKAVEKTSKNFDFGDFWVDYPVANP